MKTGGRAAVEKQVSELRKEILADAGKLTKFGKKAGYLPQESGCQEGPRQAPRPGGRPGYLGASCSLFAIPFPLHPRSLQPHYGLTRSSARSPSDREVGVCIKTFLILGPARSSPSVALASSVCEFDLP
jgi:hypothetical protein